MKRRYRLLSGPYGYTPQVKYGWLPWWSIGNTIFWRKEAAEQVCDRHNADKEAELLDYTPKAPTE